MGRIRKMSSTKSFYYLILQWYRIIWSKSTHCLRRYKFCWKKYVQFYMMPICSKTIANIKKIISRIVLFFNCLCVKFCAILATGCKVQMFNIYIPPLLSLWHQQASRCKFHVEAYFFLVSIRKRTSLQNLILVSAM